MANYPTCRRCGVADADVGQSYPKYPAHESPDHCINALQARIDELETKLAQERARKVWLRQKATLWRPVQDYIDLGDAAIDKSFVLPVAGVVVQA